MPTYGEHKLAELIPKSVETIKKLGVTVGLSVAAGVVGAATNALPVLTASMPGPIQAAGGAILTAGLAWLSAWVAARAKSNHVEAVASAVAVDPAIARQQSPSTATGYIKP